MAKKSIDVNFQSKISRNDRFAQMSQQEKLIEQKKREIQAKLEAKEKVNKPDNKTKTDSTNKQNIKSSETVGGLKEVKNIFSNDGSFLNQFRQMKESKKLDSKFKSLNRSKGRHDKLSNDDKQKSDRRESRSPKERQQQKRLSRFDKIPNFEPKITINTSFNSARLQSQPTPEPSASTNYEIPSVNARDVTGGTLLKNVTFEPPPVAETVISASPVILSVPPPQLVLNPTAPTQNVIVSTPILTAVNIEPMPAPCLRTVELSSIPPPNPIQIHNIPQPEPLNTLNIPQPAPLQVQNIPTPTTLQLSKIPTPKPLDLLSIPTPCEEAGISSDFIKNVPPPNKTVPPPSIVQENQLILSQPQTITVPSTTLIHGISTGNSPDTVTVVVTNNIPSLMAQPILPPPGIVNVNVSCPPPLLAGQSFVNRPPPIGNLRYDTNAVFPSGTPEYEAMSSLGRMVAECGDTFEDVVRQRKEQDPRLWFLFDKESEAYKQYRQFVDRVKADIEAEKERNVKQEDKYEPEMALEDIDSDNVKKEEQQEKNSGSQSDESAERRRKRKSRWGGKDPNVAPPAVMYTPPVRALPMLPVQSGPVVLSKINQSDPGLIQYAINTYGTTNLSEEDWKKAEDNYKVNLLYMDMVKKKEEAERLRMAGKHKYEYDSDEDIEGGTWEHKAREKEMMTTQIWADELTKHAEGKHHIGDFLPPEEFKKFMEKTAGTKDGQTANVSDYKEFQIKEDNIGFKMLQKLGWSEGEGLGSAGMGIVEPINKGPPREHTQGLGLNQSEEDEDEYQSYRKRMMLAYRFRPNPLNNPRRPYY